MDVNKIRAGLSDFDGNTVDRYITYIFALLNAKKNGKDKNHWMKQRTDAFFISSFKNVEGTGLHIDGVHVTIQSTGVSYDYQAYKNKMFIAYPETNIDTELVYESDTFDFNKESGLVRYTHNINDPFNRDDASIIGGYCVIKNKRGEFLTLLTRSEIDKHRKVAKTDYIWSAWFAEMARKTVIKKACKQHFDDVFQGINEIDNENYDLDNPIDIDLGVKGAIEKIESVEELQKYWEDNKEKNSANIKGFNLLVTKRKEELEKEETNDPTDS